MAVTSESVLPRHEHHEALANLVEELVACARVPVDPVLIERSVSASLRRHGVPSRETWALLLDDVVRGVGLRISWRKGRFEDVDEEVVPTAPVCTWMGDSWRLFSRAGTTLRVQGFPGGAESRRVRSGDLSDEERGWALVEAALPGSMLGGPYALSPIGRLAGLLRAEREDLVLVLVYALAAGILGLATPVAVQVLVNTLAFGAFRQPIVWLAFVLLICLVAAAVLRVLQRYAVEMLQRRVFVRMVADLAERLPRVRVDAWDKAHGPELVNRFFDVLTVQKSMSSLLLDGLSASLQAAVGMVLLAMYHPALLGFDLLLLASIILLVVGWGKPGQDTALVESKKKYLVAGWLESVAAHPHLYKLGGGSELAVRRADTLARSWLGAREGHFAVFMRQYGGALMLQAVANTALLASGGWLVLERQLTIGQLVAAEFIVATVLIGFAKFSEKLETFYDLLAAMDKLGQLVDLPLERVHGWRAPRPEGPLSLRVDGLGWRWEAGRTVFSEVSFAVEPGARVGIVGADGSGRTLLADMLLGLREPTSGRILVDTADLREVRLDALRRDVGLVRSLEVVPGSVAENLALGRPDIGPDEIAAVLGRVGLLDAVDAMARGVDTELTTSGAPLTESQRARLAVARAIVTSPRLLVVDGVMDGLAREDRDDLLDVLSADDAPWTLVVLTRDVTLASRLDRAWRLGRDGLGPLPVTGR